MWDNRATPAGVAELAGTIRPSPPRVACRGRGAAAPGGTGARQSAGYSRFPSASGLSLDRLSRGEAASRCGCTPTTVSGVLDAAGAAPAAGPASPGRMASAATGSGYHRGSRAGDPAAQPAWLLAAADCYQAMREPRAHRSALSPTAAADELCRGNGGRQASSGRLCTPCCKRLGSPRASARRRPRGVCLNASARCSACLARRSGHQAGSPAG